MRTMCLSSPLLVLLTVAPSLGFTVRPSFNPRQRGHLVSPKSRRASTLRMALDPHSLSSFLLSVDPAIQAATGAVDAAAGAVAPAVDATQAALAPAAAAADAGSGGGWFGFLTAPIEGLFQMIHSVLVGVGLDANAWGVSILLLTVLIKLVTYPLTRSQLESTNKMQALQPTIKEIQATYQSNPEVMNQKVAEVYKDNEVNPLAGCLPAIVQLPVFIGLYRAILGLSKDNLLDEPFLWLPNLEGPVYGADPAHGSDWILKNWVDGVPSLGWEDTIAFLSLPVILVVSQFISQALITPKNQDPNQSGNFVIKLLPLLIGWFSLNVPAALGIYWVANNVITTLLTLQIRASMGDLTPAAGGGGTAAPPASRYEPPSVFTPPPVREKPSGFAAPEAASSSDDVTPITAIDAEIVEDSVEDAVPSPPSPSQKPQRKRGKKKKKRRN